MKASVLSLFVFALSIHLCFGQDRAKYEDLVGKAYRLYQSKDYPQSGHTYDSAFVALGNKGMVNDRYNAACAWALASQSDSAFVQLFKIAMHGSYTNLEHISKDADLNTLHADQRWDDLIAIISENKATVEANLDRPLAAMLKDILEEDQKYRLQLNDMMEKYGPESPEMTAHWELIAKKDSANLIKVMQILDERGWLGSDIIGQAGNQALFLVIQHADLETQIKYLPMMRDAVNQKKAYPSNLALLEDRVALGQGKKQIYGSQIGQDGDSGRYYVSPLEDPDNVDKRREMVGLGSIAEYVSRWNITWDVEEYKRQLPEIEAKRRHD